MSIQCLKYNWFRTPLNVSSVHIFLCKNSYWIWIWVVTSKINMCCGERFRPQLSASANNALPMLENQLLFSSREIRNKLLLLFPIFSFSQKNLVFKFCVQALLRICLVEFALKDQENFDHLEFRSFIVKCSRLTARGSARGTKVRWGHLTEQWCWPRCDSWRQRHDAH